MSLVTPCMGVWIETIYQRQIVIVCEVTPCMGVWIETSRSGCWCDGGESHPVWVCGLKL